MQYSGKVINDVLIEKIDEGQKRINIEMEFGDNKTLIPLHINARKAWHKKKLIPALAIFFLSAISFIFFIKTVPSSSMEIKTALLFALGVMVIEKLYESLTK